MNHPATEGGRGLECDKLSQKGVDAAFREMLPRIVADRRRAGIWSLDTTLVDSYERGPQSWTEKMPVEFRVRRGYDLTPYLPVLTGRYVESGEASEKFLRDLRRTNADLFAHWYGGYFTDALKDGTNTLRITVANRWINRMIGDERVAAPYPGVWKSWRDKLYLQAEFPPSFLAEGRSPEGRYAYSTLRTRRKDDALKSAGLIGPVMGYSVARQSE